MPRRPQKIYQFKVILEGSKPEIWRQVQVPESYTFYDLHVTIQDAMGWADYHLHQFLIPQPSAKNPLRIGVPDEDYPDDDTVAGWKTKLKDHISLKQSDMIYEYDFGDGWCHTIILEKILEHEADQPYPSCIAGKMACPPEDCGGVWGYEHLLEVLSDPDHEDHDHLYEWAGGDIDPENFSPEQVKFDDPSQRLDQLKQAIG